MKRVEIATSFLEHDGRILILKRGEKVRTMKGKWAGISGYIERETPLQCAIREVEEETGIKPKDLLLIKIGKPIEARDPVNDTIWVVHPHLFHVEKKEIRLNWENITFEWIKPEDIEHYDTVPMLKEALFNCLIS